MGGIDYDVTFPLPANRYQTIGQSLAAFLHYTPAAAGFIDTLKGDAVSPAVASVEIIQNANGGSYSCIENSPDPLSTNYWVNWNGGSPTNGPLLTLAINEINNRAATSSKPTAFLWDQGYADVVAIGDQIPGLSGAQALLQFNESWIYAIGALRTAIGANIHVFMMPLGRTYFNSSGYGGAYERVRKAQLDFENSILNTHIGPGIYDMALFSNVHPDYEWLYEYGRRFANIVSRSSHSSTAFLGPSISGVTLPTSTSIQVAISPEGGDPLVKPTNPCGFRFEDNGVLLTPTFTGWSGNNAQWSLPAPALSVQCAFPNDWMPDFDAGQIIKGTNSGIPLNPFYS